MGDKTDKYFPHYAVDKALVRPGGSYKAGKRKDMTVVKESLEFLSNLAEGKAAEDRLAQYLSSLGAVVKDISDDMMPEGYYSPFDLLAEFPEVSYIIDSKHWHVFPKDRKFRDFVLLPAYHLERWESYRTEATKIIMFEVDEEPSHLYYRIYKTYLVDYLFITIKDVRDKGVLSLSGEHYKISKLYLHLFRRIWDEDWGV